MTPTTSKRAASWPEIPYAAWAETCGALHLFTQIVGKYRLAHTPWVNHSWHATLYANGRGLTTALIPDGPGGVEVLFDFLDHRVVAETPGHGSVSFALEPMSVAEFHQRFVELINTVGGNPQFHGRPNEIPNPMPFEEDTRSRPYDADAVQRFHQALVFISQVFQQFRTGFIGKVSPVHLFWGSFDLAVTRFSGRPAPEHPGGFPAMPDEITREAYSHEVSSAGFWPGGGPIEAAAFYSYAYPTPAGFDAATVMPADAYYDKNAGEFILPYEAVRAAPDPEKALLSFLESTYTAAAELGGWDRSSLECPTGKPLIPRPI
ncbi:DUF5996 family protein [Nitrosococcus watsonii]|uniref:Ava_C0101 and related proteins n=1 Tax=Nitrosococcus watsoni (strain C-113) TaxID=105559 RepID=D8K6J5_NITWC|nr:DUF5996 family protein [Nitrosococcus watsonii]ADJ28522.1 conserved hypothetical protein [Nitrosococcus watsonii C-113]